MLTYVARMLTYADVCLTGLSMLLSNFRPCESCPEPVSQIVLIDLGRQVRHTRLARPLSHALVQCCLAHARLGSAMACFSVVLLGVGGVRQFSATTCMPCKALA